MAFQLSAFQQSAFQTGPLPPPPLEEDLGDIGEEDRRKRLIDEERAMKKALRDLVAAAIDPKEDAPDVEPKVEVEETPTRPRVVRLSGFETITPPRFDAARIAAEVARIIEEARAAAVREEEDRREREMWSRIVEDGRVMWRQIERRRRRGDEELLLLLD